VTINGIGFNSTALAYFNGVPAPQGTWSPTKLVVVVPQTASNGHITVHQTDPPAGTVESAKSFTVS
jgi:hypothetical protein